MVSTNGTGLKDSVKEQRYQQRKQARLEAHQARQNYDHIINEFQPDAVEIEKGSVPGGARWTLYTVIALMVAFVAWSCWAQVDQIIVGQGKLMTTVPPVLVDTKLASPIRSIDIKFGDTVRAGQEIATLDPTFSESDVESLESKQNLLLAMSARLNAQNNGEEFSLQGHEQDLDWVYQYKQFVQQKNEHEAKLREFAAERSKFVVQQANNEQEIKFQQKNLEDYRTYEASIKRLHEKGSASNTDLLSRRLQSNDALNNLQKAQSRKLELVEELKSLQTREEAYLASMQAKVVGELVEAHEKMVDVQNELRKANQSNSYVSVRVPDSLPYKEFMVLDVTESTAGSIMEPGEPLCRLIPLGVPLEVEIEIAGKDIARIQEATAEQIEAGEVPEGSNVRVKLASFPFQKHGTLRGVIRKISEDSFEKESAGGPAATMYRARVQLLEPVKLANVPDSFRLKPGMTTTAEIKVGKRRVIQYFLYPLIRYLDTSIREP